MFLSLSDDVPALFDKQNVNIRVLNAQLFAKAGAREINAFI